MKRNRETLATRTLAIQQPVLEAAESCFSEGEQEALRCLIRLAVEFEDYARLIEGGTLNEQEHAYARQSVLSGTESFCSLAAGYRVLVGATGSRIEWSAISTLASPLLLKAKYLELYEEFLSQTSLEGKCQRLLDLFKLQLLYVAVSYDW
jgi:hypothetical protein